MALVLSRQHILTMVLLLTSTTTGISAGLGAVNYLQFYPSLERLQGGLPDLQWAANTVSLNGTVQFVVTSPSDYKGLSLKIFSSSLEIVLNGSETIAQSMPASGAKGPLDPNVPITTTISFQGTLDAPQRVTEAQSKGEDVKFVFGLVLVLSTFLDKAAATIVSYRCESRMGPGTCVQTSIGFFPTREFTTTGLGGGGGGGGI